MTTLARHILGYLPSHAVPAAVSLAAVFAYTRLLTPAEYGHYVLAISTMALLNAGGYYWLQVSMLRLMPQAEREGWGPQHLTASYISYFAISGSLIFLSLVVWLLPARTDFSAALLWAVPLTLLRSLLLLNQSYHRGTLNFSRHNLIECGQALIGLATGLVLVYSFRMQSSGALTGMLVGMACLAAIDWRRLAQVDLMNFEVSALKRISTYGMPFTLSFALAFVVSSSDRFIIEHYHGTGQVGMYAVGYTLIDRISQIAFLVVALPCFPLTIHKLERDGCEAARDQTFQNGVALIAIALPVCAGLILSSGHLAEVFVGPAFRQGALQVMPWIAVSSLLSGLSTHFFHHAFHLGNKQYLILYALGPACLVNVVLNLAYVPRYGYIAAAYSTLVSYALLFVLSVLLAKRAFPLKLPYRPALQVAGAVAAMSLILTLIDFPINLSGLVSMILCGIVSYVSFLIVFNILDMRSRFLRSLEFTRHWS